MQRLWAGNVSGMLVACVTERKKPREKEAGRCNGLTGGPQRYASMSMSLSPEPMTVTSSGKKKKSCKHN